jgi:hypothetical protein
VVPNSCTFKQKSESDTIKDIFEHQFIEARMAGRRNGGAPENHQATLICHLFDDPGFKQLELRSLGTARNLGLEYEDITNQDLLRTIDAPLEHKRTR